jgi:hypothetical protein
MKAVTTGLQEAWVNTEKGGIALDHSKRLMMERRGCMIKLRKSQ